MTLPLGPPFSEMILRQVPDIPHTMEYGYRRFHNTQGFGFPAHYMTDRSVPLVGMAHMARAESRTCPMGAMGVNMRTRGSYREDEIHPEPQVTCNPRRRTAMACARCRKRKIRCSGNPGNDSGCLSCRLAGVDVGQCIFNRVGSMDIETASIARTVASINYQHRLPLSNSPSTSIPLYAADGGPVHHRSISTAQYTPQIDTKAAVYPQTWTIPCSEDTSPVDSYSVDQSAAYMSAPNSMSHMYDQGYRRMNASARATWPVSYVGYENVAAYTGNNLPFIQTSNLRATATTESLSPLNMTSIQSALPMALPERPHPDLMARPRLPKPEPSSFQSSRSTVDQLQDQRLRSVHIMTGSGTGMNGACTKSQLNWGPDTSGSDLHSASCSEVSPVEASPHPVLASPIKLDTSLEYDPALTATSDEVAAASDQPQLNFHSATILEQAPLPTSTPAYSNFRNYTLPTSSSSDSLSLLARQSSQSNIYNYTPDTIVKRESVSDASLQAPLGNGQRFDPISQSSQPEPGSSIGNRRIPNQPVHRQSMPTLTRGF